MGYLEANPSFKLSYQRGGSEGLDCFVDSNWGNIITRRSTTGLLALFNRGAITWRSKTVSLSTAETEYYSASDMAIKVLYICNLFGRKQYTDFWMQ